MHRRSVRNPVIQTRRGLLRTLGVGSAAVAMGVTAAAAADGAQTCTGATMPPELIGQFVDGFGHSHSIDERSWESVHDDEGFLYHICTVVPQDGFLIAQNDRGQAYHPEKFSRFEWLVKDDGVWYCQQVFSADSHDDAGDFDRFPAARADNPGSGGCGEAEGFAWTNLAPR